MTKMKPPASIKMVKNMMDNWWTSKQRFQLHLLAMSNTKKPTWEKSCPLKFRKHLVVSYMSIYKASAEKSRMDAISLISSLQKTNADYAFCCSTVSSKKGGIQCLVLTDLSLRAPGYYFGEVVVAIILDQITIGVKGIREGLLKSKK